MPHPHVRFPHAPGGVVDLSAPLSWIVLAVGGFLALWVLALAAATLTRLQGRD